MSSNESSNDLNADVVVSDTRTAGSRSYASVSNYFALALATCGVGYLPLAPGTWGSLVGVAIFVGLRSLTTRLSNLVTSSQGSLALNAQLSFVALQLIAIFVITLTGIWAATRTEILLGRKDPGKVVVDEVAGQMIALLPVALFAIWPGKIWIIISFILFRFFDIVKPYPARKLESLHGGWGIMADDLAAGVYAAFTTALLIVIFEMFFF